MNLEITLLCELKYRIQSIIKKISIIESQIHFPEIFIHEHFT